MYVQNGCATRDSVPPSGVVCLCCSTGSRPERCRIRWPHRARSASSRLQHNPLNPTTTLLSSPLISLQACSVYNCFQPSPTPRKRGATLENLSQSIHFFKSCMNFIMLFDALFKGVHRQVSGICTRNYYFVSFLNLSLRDVVAARPSPTWTFTIRLLWLRTYETTPNDNLYKLFRKLPHNTNVLRKRTFCDKITLKG